MPAPTITIPDTELVERFVRASGPGGQNVNKVATAVELRFDVAGQHPLRFRIVYRVLDNNTGELPVIEKVAEALKDMDPAAVAVAKSVSKFTQGPLKDLRMGLQSKMFAGVDQSIDTLVEKRMPNLVKGTGLIGDAATAFQKWIRPILVENFGEGVGNRLADAVTLYTDIQVGTVTGLIGTVSGVVAMADPDTWKGMAEMALSVAKDPSTLPGLGPAAQPTIEARIR